MIDIYYQLLNLLFIELFKTALSNLVAIRHIKMWQHTDVQKWISNDKYTTFPWNFDKSGDREDMVGHHWFRTLIKAKNKYFVKPSQT